jgi:hypothetical protein
MDSLRYFYNLALQEATSPYDFFTRLALFSADRIVYVPNLIAYSTANLEVIHAVLSEEEEFPREILEDIILSKLDVTAIWKFLSREERRRIIDDPEISDWGWAVSHSTMFSESPQFRKGITDVTIDRIANRDKDILPMIWEGIAGKSREDSSFSTRMITRIYNVTTPDEREQLIRSAWGNIPEPVVNYLPEPVVNYLPYEILGNAAFDGILGDYTQLIYQTVPFTRSKRDMIKEIWVPRFGDSHLLFLYLRNASNDSNFILDFHKPGDISDINMMKYSDITITVTQPYNEVAAFIEELLKSIPRLMTFDTRWNPRTTTYDIVYLSNALNYRDRYAIADEALLSYVTALYNKFP